MPRSLCLSLDGRHISVAAEPLQQPTLIVPKFCVITAPGLYQQRRIPDTFLIHKYLWDQGHLVAIINHQGKFRFSGRKFNEAFCFAFIDLFAWPQYTRLGLAMLCGRSGSMEGFAKTGALTQLVTEIVGQTEESYRILLFTSNDGKTILPPKEVSLQDLWTGINFRGKYTLLGALAEQHLQDADPGNYLIITDNVEDEPQTQGDSKKFYDRLANLQQISSVDISPRIMEFEGKPYRGSKPFHKGARLVGVFIIGSDQAAAQANHQLLKRVAEAGHTVFHIRPINSDHLQLSPS